MVFGSRARGDAQEDSDLDLMIEMETDLSWFERVRRVDAIFADRRFPMDFLVFTPTEVRQQRLQRNSMIRRIESEGRVLYERLSSQHSAHFPGGCHSHTARGALRHQSNGLARPRASS